MKIISFPASAIAVTIALVASAACHAQSCDIVVLQPVTDDIGNRWPSGKTLPVDIARDEAGRRSFCAHGGSCLPESTNGSPAVRLASCRVGGALGGGDYRLVPDPRRMGAAAAAQMMTRDRVEARLNDLGFSNAGAATYADDYVRRPASAEGRLVARAMNGSTAALATMRRRLP